MEKIIIIITSWGTSARARARTRVIEITLVDQVLHGEQVIKVIYILDLVLHILYAVYSIVNGVTASVICLGAKIRAKLYPPLYLM